MTVIKQSFRLVVYAYVELVTILLRLDICFTCGMTIDPECNCFSNSFHQLHAVVVLGLRVEPELLHSMLADDSLPRQ